MTLPTVDSSTLADTSSLSGLKEAVATRSPQALREAAQQFESLFTGMVLKSMRQANFGDTLFGSDQEDMYQDMYDDQIASEISKGRGLGLADMLVQQLRRSALPGTTQGSAGAATTTSAASAGTASAPSGSASAASSSTTTGTGSSAGSCPSTAQQLQFAQSVWPDAQQAAKQLGVSPVSLVAQAALETDWGRSTPRAAGGASSNNLFGIKASAGWGGASAQSTTEEYESGTATSVKAQFRAYGTRSQCFQDYVNLLQSNPRYASALGTGNDTHAFAAGLQRGGYASDPGYAAKVAAVAGTLTRSLKSSASLPTTSGSNTF